MAEAELQVSIGDIAPNWLEQFGESELLSRLRSTEDAFVERKTRGDQRDWLKAAVALANSTPVDYPAILFIGVMDNGKLEGGACNFESLQKTFSHEIAKAYPPIYCWPKALREGDAECLAVIIPGSKNRPHFAGRSYVRVGAETKEASEEQFAALIAERNAKVYEIRQWIGKTVDVAYHKGLAAHRTTVPRFGVVVDVSQFYVLLRTFEKNAETTRQQFHLGESAAKGRPSSAPLSRVEISYNQKEEMLRLEIRDEP